jgi:plasmid stability protein
MASITLKDVPRRLHQQLRARAERNRRSLNQEALACLERAMAAEPVDVEALLRKARALRSRSKPIKQREIDDWINEGRP